MDFYIFVNLLYRKKILYQDYSFEIGLLCVFDNVFVNNMYIILVDDLLNFILLLVKFRKVFLKLSIVMYLCI